MTTKAQREQAREELQQEAEDRKSRILFSVKCLRPTDHYPYETAVFETELSVPVGADKDRVEQALAAWYKMIEGGIEVGRALAKGE